MQTQGMGHTSNSFITLDKKRQIKSAASILQSWTRQVETNIIYVNTSRFPCTDADKMAKMLSFLPLLNVVWKD